MDVRELGVVDYEAAQALMKELQHKSADVFMRVYSFCRIRCLRNKKKQGDVVM